MSIFIIIPHFIFVMFKHREYCKVRSLQKMSIDICNYYGPVWAPNPKKNKFGRPNNKILILDLILYYLLK